MPPPIVSAVPEFESDVDEQNAYGQRLRVSSVHEQRNTLT